MGNAFVKDLPRGARIGARVLRKAGAGVTLASALARAYAGESALPIVATDAPAFDARRVVDTLPGAGLRVPRLAPARALIAQRSEDEDAAKSKGKSRADALLADDNLEEAPRLLSKFYGFDQVEAAYILPRPAHWSKLTNRLELGAQGALSENIKWKLSGRFDYNAIYDLSNFYSDQVKDDQRVDAMFRETYIDVGAGNVDFRFGRQQIVWGEVVGLFFADVVSAKDLRETILTDFDLLRIPQWAARAEYFKNDIHLEAIWIPFASVDRIGKPGSDYFPYPPAPPAGYATLINNERKPERNSSNQNYGLRASILRGGWDVAGFGYRSVDSSATFYRDVVTGPSPAVVYTPRHDKITQYGLTASKDLNTFLIKTEAVYTVGKNFNVTRLSDSDGVVRQNYLDYIVSFEFPLPDEARFNLQFFQRRFSDHDPDILPKKVESGVTLFWSGKWTNKLEPQILLIHSLNRSDWLLRPKLVWGFQKEWRAVVGVDIFHGPPTGLFGQFDNKDRAYIEVRRSF